MKPLLSEAVSYSVSSLAICGYLPSSRRICQKFARNRPQGHSRKFRELRVQGTHGTNGSRSRTAVTLIPHFFNPGCVRICTRIVCQGPDSSIWWRVRVSITGR